MHSRLHVLVEFHTTTGPLPLRVPCCCFDELSSYRSLSPKKLGPPRSLVTLIICCVPPSRGKVAPRIAPAARLQSREGVTIVTWRRVRAGTRRESPASVPRLLVAVALVTTLACRRAHEAPPQPRVEPNPANVERV